MAETYTMYRFKDGTCVKLLHRPNAYAAEQAMLKTFNKTRADIVTTGLNEGNFRPFTIFDGRDCY